MQGYQPYPNQNNYSFTKPSAWDRINRGLQPIFKAMAEAPDIKTRRKKESAEADTAQMQLQQEQMKAEIAPLLMKLQLGEKFDTDIGIRMDELPSMYQSPALSTMFPDGIIKIPSPSNRLMKQKKDLYQNEIAIKEEAWKTMDESGYNNYLTPAERNRAYNKFVYGVEGEDKKTLKPGDFAWDDDQQKYVQIGTPTENSLTTIELEQQSLYDPDPKKRNQATAILDDIQKRQTNKGVTISVAGAKARGEAFGAYRTKSVFDKDSGEIVEIDMATLADEGRKPASERRYLSGTQAQKAAQQINLIQDIKINIDAAKGSIARLKTDFDQTSRFKFYEALKASNPAGAIGNLISGEFGKRLAPDQIDYLTDMQVLVENAMAMRSVVGMGQGSDELREAIKATIPSKGTFSKEFANSQLSKFERTLKNLSRGIPGGKAIEKSLFGGGYSTSNEARTTGKKTITLKSGKVITVEE